MKTVLTLVVAAFGAASAARPSATSPNVIRVEEVKPKIRTRMSEVWTKEQEDAAGIIRNDYIVGSAPHELMDEETTYPDNFTWCDKDGVNYCTMSRNQHIPQYCGSCWAHGSVSALGDRIKIARGGKGIDINLSVQHILNCGNVGSCHGGSTTGPYYWVKSIGDKTGTGISYETSNPYMACSSESQDGICPHADWTCTPENVARTCIFPPTGFCSHLDTYPPNATIAEYGEISGARKMQAEIYARGPIACGIDASPILTYTSGIATDEGEEVDHIVSVVGWGTDEEKGKYWIVRNSWGEYWGEFGYIRVAFGALKLEEDCAWATVKSFSAPEFDNQVHCYEDGSNCISKKD